VSYFLVRQERGSRWDHSRLRREQHGWDEHAAFMDGLTAEGFVVLGGPVGEGDGEGALLVIDAASEGDVKARLADDPWADGTLLVASVEKWSVLLRACIQPE
jgi:uncharacterized protein YciI